MAAVLIVFLFQELEDDTEYEEIKADVADECGQYGKVK